MSYISLFEFSGGDEDYIICVCEMKDGIYVEFGFVVGFCCWIFVEGNDNGGIKLVYIYIQSGLSVLFGLNRFLYRTDPTPETSFFPYRDRPDLLGIGFGFCRLRRFRSGQSVSVGFAQPY